MADPTLEHVFESGAPDVYAWQPVDELAHRLGCSERTVRNMVARSEVERKRLAGRAFVRLARSHPVPTGKDRHSGMPEGLPESNEALVRDLNRQLAAQAAAFAARLDDLHRALADARVETECARSGALEARLLAEVATRDLEAARALHEQERARILEAAELADVARARAERRAELAGVLARLPWYAWRQRAEARTELKAIEARSLT